MALGLPQAFKLLNHPNVSFNEFKKRKKENEMRRRKKGKYKPRGVRKELVMSASVGWFK